MRGCLEHILLITLDYKKRILLRSRKVAEKCKHLGKDVRLPKETPTVPWWSEGGSTKKSVSKHGLLNMLWIHDSNRRCLSGEIESSNHSLLLQDSSGLKLWKRRWFVLSNYCLFYYKGKGPFVVVHQSICCSCAVYGFIVQCQTVEKKRLWAASPFQAIKSCSAHLGNARTGSSRSRWTFAWLTHIWN